MNLNLQHFLTKRNLTVLEWAKEQGIKSLADYDQFMLNGEFAGNSNLRAQLEAAFSVNQIENSVAVESKDLTVELVKEETVLSTEEKPIKKKRLKPDSEPV